MANELTTRDVAILTSARLRDLTGLVFGRWSVLSHTKKTRGRDYWRCLCESGSTRSVAGATLMASNSLSCGCLNANWFCRADSLTWRDEDLDGCLSCLNTRSSRNARSGSTVVIAGRGSLSNTVTTQVEGRCPALVSRRDPGSGDDNQAIGLSQVLSMRSVQISKQQSINPRNPG